MQDEQVLIAIPGASKRHDAGQSAGAIGFRLSEEEMDHLDVISRQCMECASHACAFPILIKRPEYG